MCGARVRERRFYIAADLVQTTPMLHIHTSMNADVQRVVCQFIYTETLDPEIDKHHSGRRATGRSQDLDQTSRTTGHVYAGVQDLTRGSVYTYRSQLETGHLPWDIEMVVEDHLSDDEDGVPNCDSHSDCDFDSDCDSD